MLKIEHIGIAVKNIEQSNDLFAKLFGKPPYKMEKVESESVSTSFFMLGENKIELLEATHSESSIAKFIEKKGEGIHHIAFDVKDIVAEMKRLKEEGFILLSEEPKQAGIGTHITDQAVHFGGKAACQRPALSLVVFSPSQQIRPGLRVQFILLHEP